MNKLFAELMDKKPVIAPQAADFHSVSPTLESPPHPEVSSTTLSSRDERVLRAPDSTHDRLQEKTPEKTKSNQPSNIATLDASNIAILQLTREEIDELRETAYKNQTFRFSEDELNWLRDRSYGLTRALGRKVGQNDLLRLSLRVFRKLVTNKEKVLEEILDQIF